MLSVIVKEWKFCCIRFRFCPLKSNINLFLLIQFSRLLSRGKEKIQFLVFLSVLQVEFFLVIYFLIFWPFSYSTGYCTCGLFL